MVKLQPTGCIQPTACFTNKVLLEHLRSHLFSIGGLHSTRDHVAHKVPTLSYPAKVCPPLLWTGLSELLEAGSGLLSSDSHMAFGSYTKGTQDMHGVSAFHQASLCVKRGVCDRMLQLAQDLALSPFCPEWTSQPKGPGNYWGAFHYIMSSPPTTRWTDHHGEKLRVIGTVHLIY